MQTECPHCHTVFRIAQSQLDMANGMVRCGYCKQVFDASTRDTSRIKERAVDTVAITGQHDHQPADTEAQDRTEDKSFLSTTSADAAGDELQPAGRARSYSAIATAAWSLAILVLISTLIAEYLWFNQPEVFQRDNMKPVTSRLCGYTDCAHLQQRDTSQIEMVSRNVFSHPNEKRALMVSTTIVNHAAYAQPYPDVQIDFSNVRGELIASRRFTPEEYLQNDTQQLSLLQSNNPVTFGLEIRDPGKQAITYEFSFH